MRKPFYILLALMMCLMACSKGNEATQPASDAAVEYYTLLVDSQYNEYVKHIYFKGPIPESYREQIIENTRMFVRDIDEKHRGLKSVSVSRATENKEMGGVDVFLNVTFGDSLVEEIVVPMIKSGDIWLMK